MTTAIRTTRIAPSPTGALHLGNARTFLINAALASQNQWRSVMRIEDLDGPRIKPGATDQTIDILAWLGIECDGPPLVQSRDGAPYDAALRHLAAKGNVYPCDLSRKDILLAASAPHAEDKTPPFPPSLRPPGAGTPQEVAFPLGSHWRLIVPSESITFHDQIAGSVTFSPADETGDFVIWTVSGIPAYQLSVVVDDARAGVTDVVRGDDLLESTARQILVARMLDVPLPKYWHVPMVLGPDGRRLAKRHGDTRLCTYRAQGVDVTRIIGLIAAWSGILTTPEPMSAQDFQDSFSLPALPRTPITMSPQDTAWLTGD
jgi:glutamyl-tRNA synthetase